MYENPLNYDHYQTKIYYCKKIYIYKIKIYEYTLKFLNRRNLLKDNK